MCSWIIGSAVLFAAYLAAGEVGGIALILLALVFDIPPILIYNRFTRSMTSTVVTGIGLLTVVAYIYRNPVDTILEPSALIGLTVFYLGMLEFAVVAFGAFIDAMAVILGRRKRDRPSRLGNGLSGDPSP